MVKQTQLFPFLTSVLDSYMLVYLLRSEIFDRDRCSGADRFSEPCLLLLREDTSFYQQSTELVGCFSGVLL